MGICGLDIETLIDNDNVEDSMPGNFKPYVLSLRGTLLRLYWTTQQVTDKRKTSGKVNSRVASIVQDYIDVDFVGLNCVDQFVNWLTRYHYTTSVDRTSNITTNNTEKRLKKFNNLFVAHNGCKFDFRFLYEALYSRFGDFHMVGTIQQTKAFQGQGMIFLDTSLIIPGSLAAIARSFFPGDESKYKLDNGEIVGLTLERYHTILNGSEMTEIVTYCNRDSHVVHQIAVTFFRRLYCEPINGRFVKKSFCFSSAALAWDIWQYCFLCETMNTNPHCVEFERLSYRGGVTVDYRMQCPLGIAIDINSSYPASMCNTMPFSYAHGEMEQAVFCFSEPQAITKYNLEYHMYPYNLYYAKFAFPKSESFPSISIRCDDTLVNVISTGDYYYWLWGVELIQAVIEGEAEVLISQKIEYIPFASHKDFITYFYERRLLAKNNKDPVEDLFCKLMMNSYYGKHGYKIYEFNLIGGKHYMYDTMNELESQPHTKNVRAFLIPSQYFDLYQIKFEMNGHEFSQKGTTVRIASYITALSRCNLQTAIKRASLRFGAMSVCYCDTDSVYIDLSGSMAAEDLTRLVAHVKDKKLTYDELFGELKKTVVGFSEFLQTEVLDIRALGSCTDILRPSHFVKMIDSKTLGSYKIERLITEGQFLGAKYYSFVSWESNVPHEKQGSRVMKLKGVPAKARHEDLFDSLRASMLDEMFRWGDEMVPTIPSDSVTTTSSTDTYIDTMTIDTRQARDAGVFDVSSVMGAYLVHINDVFRSCGTGVLIRPLMKVICPTFTKRRHVVHINYDSRSMVYDFSSPFQGVDDFRMYRQDVQNNIKRKKCELKTHNVATYERYLENDAVMNSTLQTREHNLRERLYDPVAQDNLDKSRGKHMVYVAKIKFNLIPDIIGESLYTHYLDNGEAGLVDLNLFMSRVLTQCKTGLHVILTTAHKGVLIKGWTNDDMVQVCTIMYTAQHLVAKAGHSLPYVLKPIVEIIFEIMMRRSGSNVSHTRIEWTKEMAVCVSFLNCVVYDSGRSIWYTLNGHFQFNKEHLKLNVRAKLVEYKLHKKQIDLLKKYMVAFTRDEHQPVFEVTFEECLVGDDSVDHNGGSQFRSDNTGPPRERYNHYRGQYALLRIAKMIWVIKTYVCGDSVTLMWTTLQKMTRAIRGYKFTRTNFRLVLADACNENGIMDKTNYCTIPHKDAVNKLIVERLYVLFNVTDETLVTEISWCNVMNKILVGLCKLIPELKMYYSIAPIGPTGMGPWSQIHDAYYHLTANITRMETIMFESHIPTSCVHGNYQASHNNNNDNEDQQIEEVKEGLVVHAGFDISFLDDLDLIALNEPSLSFNDQLVIDAPPTSDLNFESDYAMQSLVVEHEHREYTSTLN